MEPIEMEIKQKEDGKLYFDVAKTIEYMQAGTLGVIRQEMKDLLQAEVRTIFDDSDGRILGKEGKSVIDTCYFNKDYRAGRRGQMDGGQLASYLAACGGPWLKLSPAMERFADLVRLRFDPNSIVAKGISMRDYNKEIFDWNKKAALSGTLVEADVGAIVPIEFLATVIEFAIEQSKILPKLWRIPLGAYQTRIPQLSQSAGSYFGGILLYHPDEAYEKTTTKPAFTYKTLSPKKLIGLIPISDELVMDSSINIINYLTGLFTRAFQYASEGEVIAGTGLLGQMTGIITDPLINVVGRQTAGTVKRRDVINLESALDENFQDLTYLTRRLTVNTLRDERITGSTPIPIYFDGIEGGLYAGMKPQLNGYEVIKTRNVPAMGAKGDIICGELGYYLWGIRQDMTIDMSAERYFEYDIKAIRFVVRQDGLPGVSIAFSVLDSHPES
jgi:HK97 family phage major capsid protein